MEMGKEKEPGSAIIRGGYFRKRGNEGTLEQDKDQINLGRGRITDMQEAGKKQEIRQAEGNPESVAIKKAAGDWARALCFYAEVEESFFHEFWERLQNSVNVYREFVYYLEHQNFLCEYRIEGYTIVDIMVWQMDHFKAQMDRGYDDMKRNGDKMLLMAFDTMLKMEKDPAKYVNLMQTETGTDYPDKY